MKRTIHSPVKPWELQENVLEEQVTSLVSEVAPSLVEATKEPTPAKPSAANVRVTRTSSTPGEPELIEAQTVLIRVFPEGYAIAVLPTASQPRLEEVAARLGAQLAFAATEAETRRLLAGHGKALEPFGSRYGLRTVMDLRLAGARALSFVTGDSSERVEIAMDRYQFQERPIMGFISHESDEGK